MKQKIQSYNFNTVGSVYFNQKIHESRMTRESRRASGHFQVEIWGTTNISIA